EGSSGFCTVASTKGIPRTLLKKLESLSGYQHVHPAGSGGNPVNFSHCIISVQQQVYHVVSRIADAGPDHTGRSNKIAHHLAIPAEDARRIRGGPLSLLSDRRFWFSDWGREPAQLPPDRLPKSSPIRTSGFEAWEDVFGDPGYAGLLGDSAKDKPKPVCVVVPSADDALELLREAVQLVPPAKQWQLGFSTYVSQAVSEGCHWRFAQDGTEAARKMRGRSAALLVDHKGPPSLPRGNHFVEAARTGDVSALQNTAAPARRAESRRPAKKKPAKASREVASSVEHRDGPSRSAGTRRTSSKGLRPSQMRRRQAGAKARARSGRGSRYSDDEWEDSEDVHEVNLETLEVGSNRQMKPILIGLVIAAIVAVAGFAAYQFMGGSDNADTPVSNTEVEEAAP
ncbi:MAG: hypothetical protein AB8G99_15020, partial [Planctomycetaceae bacterium]